MSQIGESPEDKLLQIQYRVRQLQRQERKIRAEREHLELEETRLAAIVEYRQEQQAGSQSEAPAGQQTEH